MVAAPTMTTSGSSTMLLEDDRASTSMDGLAGVTAGAGTREEKLR